MMRFAVLTALIAVTLASAQTPRTAGCTNASGVVYGLLANTSVAACAAQTACETNFNTCIASSAAVNCTHATGCVSARIICLGVVSENTTGCPGLNGLHMSMLKVASGAQLYNESDAFMSCKASSCRWLNATFNGAGTNCTIDVDQLCASPVVAVATVLFRGNFTAILADPVKRAAFAAAIARDLTKALKVLCRVRRMFIAGTRRQTEQTLVVEIEAVGVSANNAAFKEAFAAVAANPGAFLTEASASYTALTGQQLSILKIGTGGSSTAFSSIPTPTARPATSTPTTTTHAPPTPSQTTTAGTTRAPTVTTTTTTSGSLARSLAAAAMVAIISALLF